MKKKEDKIRYKVVVYLDETNIPLIMLSNQPEDKIKQLARIFEFPPEYFFVREGEK
jgi:hypothetical protein